MTDLTPQEKEEIARLWCSKENSMELKSSHIMSLENGKIYPFQFDITSHPQRKEDQALQQKIKEYENKHGKIKSFQDNPYFIRWAGIYGYSSDKPDTREIIGMVKSGKHDKGGNTYHSILGDCFLLTRAKANKKYMILTDKEMYDYFHNRCKAILGEIELTYLDTDEYRYLLDQS